MKVPLGLNWNYQIKCTTFLKCINFNNVSTPTNILRYFLKENNSRINIVIKRINSASFWNKLLSSQKIAKMELTIEWYRILSLSIYCINVYCIFTMTVKCWRSDQTRSGPNLQELRDSWGRQLGILQSQHCLQIVWRCPRCLWHYSVRGRLIQTEGQYV